MIYHDKEKALKAFRGYSERVYQNDRLIKGVWSNPVFVIATNKNEAWDLIQEYTPRSRKDSRMTKIS